MRRSISGVLPCWSVARKPTEVSRWRAATRSALRTVLRQLVEQRLRGSWRQSQAAAVPRRVAFWLSRPADLACSRQGLEKLLDAVGKRRLATRRAKLRHDLVPFGDEHRLTRFRKPNSLGPPGLELLDSQRLHEALVVTSGYFVNSLRRFWLPVVAVRDGSEEISGRIRDTRRRGTRCRPRGRTPRPGWSARSG
jgi:hypothetical protein